jgi:hypothetical protein
VKKKPEPVRVACVACGRLIVASKNGRPRRHVAKQRLYRRSEHGTCPGTFEQGDAP